MGFAALFIVSLLYFHQDISEYYRVKRIYTRIKREVKDDRVKKIDWEALFKINKDIVAWIEVPGTNISYPVVQAENNTEYLNKDINGAYSIYGAIFLDSRLYGTDLESNYNNIIYGHNMGRWTDVMFTPLKEYLDSSYLKGHETVLLYTPKKTYHYLIASVEYADLSSDVYKTDFSGKDYCTWIKEQTKNSLYPCLEEKETDFFADLFTSGKELKEKIEKYGNTLTLSTCDTTHNTGKKIVVFCILQDKQ